MQLKVKFMNKASTHCMCYDVFMLISKVADNQEILISSLSEPWR